MTREEMDDLMADVMGDHFARLAADLELRLERAIASRPLPPFVPPAMWSEGKRYAAGSSVRWRNGIFFAQRDSEGEPGHDDAWLPLVVGLAGFEMHWSGDRTFCARAVLSDGRAVEIEREVALPIVRGYWNAETTYLPGDRVFRHGEWNATAMSLGVDPTSPDTEGRWEKVGGRYARALALAVDDDGTVSESGKPIGSIKPLVQGLLEKLLAQRAA